VKNPFRSEADAYRFVLLTVAYFGSIAIAAAVGGLWPGLGVFIFMTALAGLWIMQGRREQPPRTAHEPHGAEDERRVLVIANETVGGRVLRDQIKERAAEFREHVLVVAPALNSPLRHWMSDEDGARDAAQRRLERSVEHLRELGVDARGEVGDPDPLQAIEDALRTFAPDEVIISTHPEGRSNWLERGVVTGARERFAVPITHVVVDLEAEQEEVNP
jgi:hypothetical protein